MAKNVNVFCQNDSICTVLLNSKQFFLLENFLKQNKKSISPHKYYLNQMFVQQAFGNYKQAERYAEKLKKINNKKNLTDSIKQRINLSLLSFYALDAMQKFDYSKVAENYGKILENFSQDIDSAQIVDYQNNFALFSALKNTPPQKIHRLTQNIELQSFKNQFNHLLVPVLKGNIENKFVFDTGSSFAIISDSIAKLMNLTTLPVDVNVLTYTNLQIQPQLAVADSFYIGAILFQNIVFLVVPQSVLTFPMANYSIYGIIGFPQIVQMQEIRFQKDGKIIIPKKPKRQSEKNMLLDGYNPVIQIFTENDTLLFRFDSGAQTSELSYKYFEKHKENILQNTEKEQLMRGGAAGIEETEVYVLKNFNFRIGKAQGTLSEISVIAENHDFLQLFDGNLGQDILQQYEEVILNFKDFYLKLKK